MIKSSTLIAAISTLILASCADDGSCHIASIGTLDVLNDRGSPIVRATINGHPVAFLVDTGAAQSFIWSAQINPLGLEVLPQSVLVSGFGGSAFANPVSIDTLGIGVGQAHNVTFLTTGDKAGHRTIAGLPLVGLFGADFLRNYDIALDLPQHQITLFDVDGCTDQIPPWPGKYTSIPFSTSPRDNTKIQVSLKVNNHSIDAMLDSGAGRTVISEDDALDSGITKDELKTDKTTNSYGISEDNVKTYHHKFSTFSLENITLHNLTLEVADADINLLGADFLRHYRLWIPKRKQTLYLQPEGNTAYLPVEARKAIR